MFLHTNHISYPPYLNSTILLFNIIIFLLYNLFQHIEAIQVIHQKLFHAHL